jgi:hypothetical protein
MRKLKVDFNDYDKIEKNYSQASQDLFALICTDGKRNGTFLDLGCSDPTNINNTYLLENDFNWTGVSIDIDKSLIEKFQKVRKTKSFNLDCTKLNFDEILENYDNNHIDYLSLDLEPASVTFACLKTLPLNKIEFSVITYEHDEYRFGETYKVESRKIFEQHGYKLICSNVSDNKLPYEDWYINPKYVDFEKIKTLVSDNKNWQEILFLN